MCHLLMFCCILVSFLSFLRLSKHMAGRGLGEEPWIHSAIPTSPFQKSRKSWKNARSMGTGRQTKHRHSAQCLIPVSEPDSFYVKTTCHFMYECTLMYFLNEKKLCGVCACSHFSVHPITLQKCLKNQNQKNSMYKPSASNFKNKKNSCTGCIPIAVSIATSTLTWPPYERDDDGLQ